MSTIKRLLRNKVFRVTVVLIALLLPFTSDYRFVVVDGNSMHPTYVNWELVVEEKVSSLGGYWTPRKQDVIVVVDETGDKLIKRVIALPGEEVSIRGGNIYVNDKLYRDSFTNVKIGILLVGPDGVALRDWKTGKKVYEYIPRTFNKLKKDEYWVIGDNRDYSWHGVVKMKEIEGKVLY